ncbi:hypothetical protein MC885_018875 [Smutsia gigantea]|nr:hypothetical protein MC885_018875 [Smutsia gigantea]
MTDQIPLYPVRGAAASRKRTAYYSAAGPAPGAEWPSRPPRRGRPRAGPSRTGPVTCESLRQPGPAGARRALPREWPGSLRRPTGAESERGALRSSDLTEYCSAGLSALFLSSTRYQLEDESAPLDEMPLMMSEEGFENDESDYHTLPRARITRRKRGLEWLVCGGWKFLCTSSDALKRLSCDLPNPLDALRESCCDSLHACGSLVVGQECLSQEVYVSVIKDHFVPVQGFVLAVTITREAVDEFRRFQRDKEVNSQLYSKLTELEEKEEKEV